jgi:DNA-directed RNA polymerase alpha subunit
MNMITESQIDYCVARIREQLTISKGSVLRPNINTIVEIVKQTIDEAYSNNYDDSDSVFDIGLNDRTANLLESSGYETVRALKAATKEELMELRQFGVSMLSEVQKCLAKRRLRLRNDQRPISRIRQMKPSGADS